MGKDGGKSKIDYAPPVSKDAADGDSILAVAFKDKHLESSSISFVRHATMLQKAHQPASWRLMIILYATLSRLMAIAVFTAESRHAWPQLDEYQ